MNEVIKTFFWLGAIAFLFVFVGYHVAGEFGALLALGFAAIANVISYYYSESLALKAYRARPLDSSKHRTIFNIVADLAEEARIPMPKLWIINDENPNAFATGRNPENSSIAMTSGILDLLSADELRAVLAHEMSHIKNRDILWATVAATFAAAIGVFGDILRWRMWFGGSNNRNNRDNLSGWAALAVIILAPLAALVLQLSISRQREFLADKTGAEISHSPLELAEALKKIEASATKWDRDQTSVGQQAFSSLFFASPFKKAAGWFASFFSTHPAVKDRVKKLEELSSRYR